MKQFFGAFFGSIVGLIVATLLAVLIIVSVIKSSINGALAPDKELTLKVVPNSVIHITLNGPIDDRQVESPFGDLKKFSNISEEEGKGLNLLIRKIAYAKSDGNIKGIYLEIKKIGSGIANITELRNLLLDFKKSGKFVYCYAEDLGQKEYYLASAADKIYLNPEGSIEFKGLSMNIVFFKNAFQKLGIEAQIFRHGRYKSAIEPFILDKMSDANRHQTRVFLNGIWNSILEGISKERNMRFEELNRLADNLDIQSPEDAVGSLIDATAFEDQVLSILKKKLNVPEEQKLSMVELGKYDVKQNYDIRERIAVIYAAGPIKSGEGNDDEVGSDRIVKAIKDARNDGRVKAIVLRVNSPGGSALASDVIWREVIVSKKVKPVIVSMGNFAASGGYYISCGADRIFADPNTITGSIGVFGFVPNIKKGLEDILGVTVDTVSTNKYSDVGTPLFPAREREREYIQKGVEKVYDTFITRVAEGRKMTKNEIDSIGQGRVWTGEDALRINLIDELGGLNEAIVYAAKKAKLTEYRLMELPKLKNPFAGLLGRTEDETEGRFIQKRLGPAYTYFKQLQDVLSVKGVQARLPMEIIIN